MESKSSEKAFNLKDNQEFPIVASSQIELACKETQRIFADAFSTVENFLGKSAYPFSTQKQQLYPYIVSLCGNPKDEAYKAIKDEGAKRKILLHLTVKTAKILHPNYDISKFFNVHCKLWVELGKQFKTTAKDSASNLYWNETFV
ncbi:uncharacterized protein LOC118186683, partial [Stegodyphus dumicola]|uniref:uncharacterized protein LOC118186683 n=1 Tax=Stegodyphus dumicola TaxID=202533 RepID=UPI0015ADD847